MGPSTARRPRLTWAQAMDRNALLRTERALADIRLRMRFADDAQRAEHSRQDIRRLVGAVDGVMALHSARADGTCRSCSDGDCCSGRGRGRA